MYATVATFALFVCTGDLFVAGNSNINPYKSETGEFVYKSAILCSYPTLYMSHPYNKIREGYKVTNDKKCCYLQETRNKCCIQTDIKNATQICRCDPSVSCGLTTTTATTKSVLTTARTSMPSTTTRTTVPATTTITTVPTATTRTTVPTTTTRTTVPATTTRTTVPTTTTRTTVPSTARTSIPTTTTRTAVPTTTPRTTVPATASNSILTITRIDMPTTATATTEPTTTITNSVATLTTATTMKTTTIRTTVPKTTTSSSTTVATSTTVPSKGLCQSTPRDARGDTASKNCQIFTVFNITYTDGSSSGCNAVFTYATINGVYKPTILTAEICTNFIERVMDHENPFLIHIGNHKYKLMAPTFTVVSGGDGTAFIDVTQSNSSILDEVIACLPNFTCPYNKNTMRDDVSWTHCTIVGWGVSSVEAYPHNSMNVIALSISEGGCQDLTGPAGSNSLCFKTSWGKSPLMCGNSYGSPVFCLGIELYEWVLVGVSGSCVTFPEISVLPHPA